MGLDEMKHPIQPFGDDGKGVLRFKGNKVVQYLLDNGGLDLNDLARAGRDLPKDDWEQFHQLIGYSVSGIPGLTLETRSAVDQMEEGVMDWRDARIKALEEIIEDFRRAARPLATAVFDVHPDDLRG